MCDLPFVSRFMSITTTACLCLMIGFMHPVVALSQDTTVVSKSNNSKVVTQPQIQQWVARLGDEKFTAREMAHRQLIKAGEAAMPAVQRAVTHDDPEIRSRARSILLHMYEHGDFAMGQAFEKIAPEILAPRELAVFRREHAKKRFEKWVRANDVVLGIVNVGRYDSGSIDSVDFSFLASVDSSGLGKRITNASLVYLKELSSLHTVSFHNNAQITDAQLVHLTQLKSLQCLDFVDIKISDAGLVHLGRIKSLQMLVLYNTKITDAGLVHLAKLKSLKRLSLRSTEITDAGLVHLAKCNSLEKLELLNTKTTDAGVARLKKALPKCTVVTGT